MFFVVFRIKSHFWLFFVFFAFSRPALSDRNNGERNIILNKLLPGKTPIKERKHNEMPQCIEWEKEDNRYKGATMYAKTTSTYRCLTLKALSIRKRRRRNRNFVEMPE